MDSILGSAIIGEIILGGIEEGPATFTAEISSIGADFAIQPVPVAVISGVGADFAIQPTPVAVFSSIGADFLIERPTPGAVAKLALTSVVQQHLTAKLGLKTKVSPSQPKIVCSLGLRATASMGIPTVAKLALLAIADQALPRGWACIAQEGNDPPVSSGGSGDGLINRISH